jgi:signal peptidase
LALETLKRIWKNDYFQMALMVALMALIVFGFWFGSQLVMHTEYPALAVASGSMLPTLNVGDVIIVQGVPAAQINANYINGDIVVFKSPRPEDPNFRIVHRAVKKVQSIDGTWTITTHGDNNPSGVEEQFNENALIGKVVAKVPYIGNFSLFVNKLGNFYIFLILIVIFIGILFSLFSDDTEKESAGKGQKEKRKLFGKLDIGMIFSIILEILLIGFLIFNISGSFTFWQIGADPPQGVTIRGMYPDLQYHLGFNIAYNDVHNASLSQGFLTYAINCFVTDGAHQGIRSGVPVFSWIQASLLLFLLFNVWMAVKYFHIDKKLGAMLKAKTEHKESSENNLQNIDMI